MSLKLEGISKKYGKKTVLNDLSFEMNKPGILGLLGRNGAGKTTTIRIILGIISKNSGIVTWNGKSITRENVNFGYLPEERGIYPKAKVIDQLIYFAELKGMNKSDAEKSIRYWAKRLEVEEYLDVIAEKLSKGNQQKIQLMTVLIHDPELIILDEPFSGLDPVNADIIKKIIMDLIKDNKYIILSSHQMNIIEEFCKDIIILDKGNTILKGNLEEIKKSYDRTKLVVVTDSNIDKYITKKYKLISKKDKCNEISFSNIEDAYKLLEQLVSNGIKIDKFEIKEPTLTEIFIDKVGK